MFKTIRKWLQSEQRFVNLSTDPRAARHWHNPTDPVQADRIEAAAARREERADKLARNTLESVSNNWAHGCGDRRVHACPVPNHTGSLNPFYIAK